MQTKKWATEVALNALRARVSGKTCDYLRLCESLQIKNPNPAKNRIMRLTVSTPAITTLSKNMTRLLHLACCDRAKLTNQTGEKIDRDQ